MQLINRKNTVYYPLATKKIEELQNSIIKIIKDSGIENRMIFPNTSKIDTFDEWDDLKKEYLVDFINSEEEISVFNPEYFTVIKDYNQKYFSNVNHSFYYIQNTLSYSSIERKSLKEDLVIGFCTLNSKDPINDWTKITKLFSIINSKIIGAAHSTYFSNDGTIQASLDGLLIGFGRTEPHDNIMEAHFSITDLYTVLNRIK
jgi:hypothetical protein